MQVSVQSMGTISSSFIFNSPRCYSRSISHRPLISNTLTLKKSARRRAYQQTPIKVEQIWAFCNKTSHSIKQLRQRVNNAFAAGETNRKLGQVNYHKEFWDFYPEELKERIGRQLTGATQATIQKQLQDTLRCQPPRLQSGQQTNHSPATVHVFSTTRCCKRLTSTAPLVH